MKKILIISFFIFSCDTQIQGVILEDHNYSKIIYEIYNDYSSNKYDLFYNYLDDDVIAYYSSESIVGADELIKALTFEHYYFSNIKIEKVQLYTVFLSDGSYVTNYTTEWSAVGNFTNKDYKLPGHIEFLWKNDKIIELKVYINTKAINNEIKNL